MTDAAATGGGGFDITSLLFRQAGGHLLHQAAREEVGIDGVLELRNEEKRAYGALLLVQIKALDDVEQADDDLRYTPTPRDAAYAENQPLPFLLVVAHPSRFEAWWKCLQDAWADPRQRASRTVTFDREHDRLDAGSGEALREVYERRRPRHDRATRAVLDNPFHAYGAGREYDIASALSLTRDKDRAAEAWEAVNAAIRRHSDVPSSLRISLLERRVGEQLWAGRTRASALLRVELAEAKLDADLPGAASDLDASYPYAPIHDDPGVVRLAARARAARGDLDGLRAAVAKPPRRMSERRALAAALCDALLLRGEAKDAAPVARSVLPPKRLRDARDLALAVDELDASGQLGQTGVWTWEDLVAQGERAGAYWHATVLQRLGVWHAREGDAKAAQIVFRNAARVWATLEGADEQVGEALLSEDLAGIFEGWLTGVLPPGTRPLIVQLGGSADVPAARGERLISLGLAQIVHGRLDDAVESLTLAASVHRRAGNLSALRRTYGHLVMLADAREESAEALRWCVLAGAAREAAERAARVEQPRDVLAQLQLGRYAAPWELNASLAALGPVEGALSRGHVASVAAALLRAARAERALPGANPIHYALAVLAAVSDRLPKKHLQAATVVLSLALPWKGPDADAAARGLTRLLERGTDAAGEALFESILEGRDLPVLIPGWIRNSDEDTRSRLVKAAMEGNEPALSQAVWADLPHHWPQLRPQIDATLKRWLDALTDEMPFGHRGLQGWAEPAVFALHASPHLRQTLIDSAAGVLCDASQDDYSAVAALVALAQIAAGIAPARATELFDAIVGLARGDSRDAVERDPHARPLPPGALQAAAIQACCRLAARSCERRSEAEDSFARRAGLPRPRYSASRRLKWRASTTRRRTRRRRMPPEPFWRLTCSVVLPSEGPPKKRHQLLFEEPLR